MSALDDGYINLPYLAYRLPPVAALPEGHERIVSMVIHRDVLIVATERGLFQRGGDGVMVPIRFHPAEKP